MRYFKRLGFYIFLSSVTEKGFKKKLADLIRRSIEEPYDLTVSEGEWLASDALAAFCKDHIHYTWILHLTVGGSGVRLPGELLRSEAIKLTGIAYPRATIIFIDDRQHFIFAKLPTSN